MLFSLSLYIYIYISQQESHDEERRRQWKERRAHHGAPTFAPLPLNVCEEPGQDVTTVSPSARAEKQASGAVGAPAAGPAPAAGLAPANDRSRALCGRGKTEDVCFFRWRGCRGRVGGGTEHDNLVVWRVRA